MTEHLRVVMLSCRQSGRIAMSDSEQAFAIKDKTKLGVSDIQATAAAAWADMQEVGTAAHAAAVKAGIDLKALPKELGQLLSIKPAGAGLGSVDLLIGALGPVAWDVWKHVLLPQIRARWGDDAIKAKAAAAKKAAAAAKKSSK